VSTTTNESWAAATVRAKRLEDGDLLGARRGQVFGQHGAGFVVEVGTRGGQHLRGVGDGLRDRVDPGDVKTS